MMFGYRHLLAFGLCSLGCSSAFQAQHFSRGNGACGIDPCSFRFFSVPASQESDGDDGSLSNVAWLQERFDLTEQWAKKTTFPGIISMDQTTMIERINWLQKRLKLKDGDLGRIIRIFPRIVTYRPDTSLEPKFHLLEEKLGVNTPALRRLILKAPPVLTTSTHRMPRNLKWIEKRLNVSTPEGRAKIISKCPGLLAYSIEENLEPTFNQLQDRLGLNDTQLALMCCKQPTILGLNFTTGLQPNLDWLQEHLDVDDTKLSKMLVRYPALFTCNVEATFVPKMAWLQKTLCLDDEAARKLVRTEPGVLAYSPSEKMEPLLWWLQENLALESLCDVGRVLVKQPSLFNKNTTTNLGPTLDFFKMCLGNEEALELLQTNPRCFTASLEKRLKPRLEQMRQKGIEVDTNWARRMAVNTNQVWQARLGKI